MKLKPYLEYKDSGVEWIGEIPRNWDATKLKLISRIETGMTPSKNDERYYSDGDFPWVKPDELNGLNPIKTSNTKLNNEGKALARKIPKGSILVCCIGTLGKIGVAGVELSTNQQINSVIPHKDKLDSNFAKYLILSSKVEYEKFANSNVVSIINKNQQGDLIYPIPPISEQNLLSRFLDKKTSEIDLTIEKDTRLIELLKEKRTALINHVVTKGLDPTVKMKDSGVEWIGEIPEDWEVKKLKLISTIVLGKMLTPLDKGGYYLKPYLRAQNISWEHVNVNEIKEMWFSKNELNIYRLQKDDLLVSEGGEVGRTAIWREEISECYIQNSVHKVTLNPENNPKYFLYAFESCGKSNFFSSIVNRVSIAHLTREKLKEITFPVPSRIEQDRITKDLDVKIRRIDQTIQKIQENIDLLEEYKKSLIHHVVTGKVNVIKED